MRLKTTLFITFGLWITMLVLLTLNSLTLELQAEHWISHARVIPLWAQLLISIGNFWARFWWFASLMLLSLSFLIVMPPALVWWWISRRRTTPTQATVSTKS